MKNSITLRLLRTVAMTAWILCLVLWLISVNTQAQVAGQASGGGLLAPAVALTERERTTLVAMMEDSDDDWTDMTLGDGTAAEHLRSLSRDGRARVDTFTRADEAPQTWLVTGETQLRLKDGTLVRMIALQACDGFGRGFVLLKQVTANKPVAGGWDGLVLPAV